jgi:hypothetical protein
MVDSHLILWSYQFGNSPTAQENRDVVRASKSGQLETVKYLVEECKADNKVIISASLNGHLEIVKYLVEERKSRPTTTRDNSVTAF